MKATTLKDVYVDELRDLYNAEQQLSRLEQIFQALGKSSKGKKCKGMERIVAEGAEVISEDYEGAAMDAAIISAAQRARSTKKKKQIRS